MTLNDIYHALDPVAFTIGPFQVRWYGMAYIVGFCCVALIMWLLARRWKIRFDADALSTFILCVMVGVVLGARLGYVLVYGDGWYWAHPEDILAFHKGGMSFHGGLVGAVIAGIVATRITKIPFLTLADLAVCGAPVALFFGRCANFINGELWGAVTDVPWGVIFDGAAGPLPRHPSQLYEALLEGVVIFLVLFILSRKNNPPRPRGTFLAVFFVLYGIFRFAVEFVRQPDAQIGYLLGIDWLTMGQVLSVPLIIAGIVMLFWVAKRNLPQQGAPEPAAPAVAEPLPAEEEAVTEVAAESREVAAAVEAPAAQAETAAESSAESADTGGDAGSVE